jgi:hypothetical protein
MVAVELLLVIIAALAILGVALGLLKVLFWFVVLPFKLGAWALKGVFGLAVMTVMAVLGLCAFAFFPLVIAVVALPAVLLVCGIVALVKLVS